MLSYLTLVAALWMPTSPVASPRQLASPRVPVVSAALKEGSVGAKAKADTVGRIYTKEAEAIVPGLGGLQLGLRKLVVVTGASSGLGLAATRAMCDKGYFVVCAVRDAAKMDAVAAECGIPKNSYKALRLELASLQSVKDFVSNLNLFMAGRPLTHLVCNAAVYLPTDPQPSFTDEGYEMSIGVNHLGHFLLVQLLLPSLKRAGGARVCIVGSVTGNSNTIAGKFVKPVAELGELDGLKAPGAVMVDGDPTFDGAKAYKDAKALNMMTVRELHRRYHDSTGITFNSMYPGCIAESNLFREKRQWFRDLFPVFMKAVGAYVSEDEAGERLAQVIDDPRCTKSGVYWSWNGNAQQFGSRERIAEGGGAKVEMQGAGGAGGEIFENEFSGMIRDDRRAALAWDYSMAAVGDFL